MIENIAYTHRQGTVAMTGWAHCQRQVTFFSPLLYSQALLTIHREGYLLNLFNPLNARENVSCRHKKFNANSLFYQISQVSPFTVQVYYTFLAYLWV